MSLRKKSPNKRRIARETLRQMRPEHREAIEEAVGYGPGDAYIAFWDELAELKRDRRSAARSLTQPTLKDEARTSLQKRADYLQETFISTLISILPFERPRLANLKFQDNDRRGETIDLTVLPDVRLKQLKEITLLLAGAGSAVGSADEADGEPPPGAPVRRSSAKR
jgi:hypothetical protein